MIKLDFNGCFAIQGDAEDDVEAKKLEHALREFLKFYRTDAGEVASYTVEVAADT